MSHAFYSSGDKDDAGNYQLPKIWGDTPLIESKPITDVKTYKVDSPDIDFEFIAKKISSDNASEKYRWIRISQYAKAVKELYWQAIAMFYKTFCNIEISNSPFKKVSFGLLEEAARNLDKVEAQVLDKFYMHDRQSVISVSNKYAKFKKIIQAGNTAWLMYHSLVKTMQERNIATNKVDLSVLLDNAQKFKTALDSTDKTNHQALLKLFRNGLMVKRKADQMLSQNFVAKNHGYPFYAELDQYMPYDNLIDIVGGVKISHMTPTLAQIKTDLTKFNKYPQINRMIKFYENFFKVKKNVDVLYRMAQAYTAKNGALKINAFESENGINYYDLVVNYKTSCESLLQSLQGWDEMFSLDVKYMLDIVNKCLDTVTEPYNQWKAEDDRLAEEAAKMFKNRPNNK